MTTGVKFLFLASVSAMDDKEKQGEANTRNCRASVHHFILLGIAILIDLLNIFRNA
ncbi:hypothetical protein BSAF29S_05206 [Bacillus safensis subsp. safensis]